LPTDNARHPAISLETLDIQGCAITAMFPDFQLLGWTEMGAAGV
jgi:hypothetical protein